MAAKNEAPESPGPVTAGWLLDGTTDNPGGSLHNGAAGAGLVAYAAGRSQSPWLLSAIQGALAGQPWFTVGRRPMLHESDLRARDQAPGAPCQ